MAPRPGPDDNINMLPPLVVVDRLTKRFGSATAVDGISFAIPQGEIFGFLGPNGAGKTTTIKMLTGLLQPTSGRASVGGYNVATHPLEAKRLFGYVPDEPALYPKLTAIEFLNFVGDVYEMPPRRKAQRIRELLALFELAGDAGVLLESFSHGMRQKVALCAALLHEPKVYFLDEPTVGLDPKSARMLKDIVRAVTRSGGSVMLSTHIMEIAESLCDRVAIIDRGRIAAIGTVPELREQRGRHTLEEIFLHLTGDIEDHRIADIFRETAPA
jgi:ABC-2 type transport system ATP-binding protein